MNEEIIATVEQYLYGKLSVEEKKDFEARYATDAQYAREVAQSMEVLLAVESYGEKQLKESLYERLRTQGQDKRRKTIPLRKTYTIAASVILLISIGSWLYFFTLAPTDHLSVYDQHFQPPSITIERDTTSNNNYWIEVIEYYHSGNYTEAVALLEAEEAIRRNNSEVALYTGICYLMLDNTEKALENFKQVRWESVFFAEAQWYTALTFLKLGNKEKTFTALDEIIERPGHYKRNDAMKIKEQLE